MKKILYLHGFASSGASGTVELLRKWFWDRVEPSRRAVVVAPDIPLDPLVAEKTLEALAYDEMPDLVIGTSMGGMYAQMLHGFTRICVNPAFWISRKYDHVTKETVAHFQELESRQFDGIDDDDRMLCHGLFGDEDTLVGPESRAAFEEHYPGMAQSFHGGHHLNSEVLADAVVPFIRSLNVI